MISFGKDGLILFQSKENKISNILNHKKIINKAKQKILTLCRDYHSTLSIIDYKIGTKIQWYLQFPIN